MNAHDGHRQRMRRRFRENGLDGFAPHEVVELLLFYGRARGDVNPTAHALLDHFGSLKGVLEADAAQLMTVDGVGEETATLISLMLPMFRYYERCVCEEKKRIDTLEDAEAYCASLLAGKRSEHFYLISLTGDHQLLGSRLIARGTLTEVAAYPRLIAEAALNQNAQGVILCHNHPSGVCAPSQDDLNTTSRLVTLLAGLGISVLDHIIIAGGEAYSMARTGELLAMQNHNNTLVPKDGKSHLAGGTTVTPEEGRRR